MRTNRVGRALGIGVRLASQRILPPAPVPRTPAEQRAAAAERIRRAELLGRRVRNTGKGGKRFGRAVWNPFASATGTLWYEVTGMFFALFSLFFVQHLWNVRASARSGPDHRTFIAYTVLASLFAYFAVTSFLRARRRSRR